jgi:hypothetical protein
MRNLELAGYPTIDPRPLAARARRFPLSRVAFAVSVVVHVVAGYALSRHEWPATLPPPSLVAEFIPFVRPQPPPAAPTPEPSAVEEAVVAPTPVAPPPEAREQPQPTPAPTPRAADVIEQPIATFELSPEASEPPQLIPAPRPSPSAVELDEARQRAAEEVIAERSATNEYLTFSMDDVAPPRPAKLEPKPSIFDGGFGDGPSRGPNVGQAGQARTRFGHKLSALCNALTGGFSLMGWGSFCAGPSDGGLTGLFPEVRPDYLDLMPECVDTRDTAPALALEAPFPTVKCRLVKRVDPDAEQP